MRTVENNNNYQLEEWKKQIANYPCLTINEAKDLYNLSINASDDAIKKEYMNQLILGTTYVLLNYVETYRLDLLTTASYDLNDIISAFIEVWVEKIHEGVLNNVDGYSNILNSSFINKVYSSLCGDEIVVSEQFYVTSDKFIDLLYQYIVHCFSGSEEPFKIEFDENDYYGNRFIDIITARVLPLFEKIYSGLKAVDDFNISRTRLKDQIKFFIHYGLFDPLTERRMVSDAESSIIHHVYLEEFVNAVDNSILFDLHREILHERYGLDNEKPLCLEEVGKLHGVSRERVRQHESKALRRLRGNKKIRDFNKV